MDSEAIKSREKALVKKRSIRFEYSIEMLFWEFCQEEVENQVDKNMDIQENDNELNHLKYDNRISLCVQIPIEGLGYVRQTFILNRESLDKLVAWLDEINWREKIHPPPISPESD
jgi:hypothetical protein